MGTPPIPRLANGLLILSLLTMLFATSASAQVSFEAIATGLTLPLQVTNAGDDSSRLYVVEQDGKIKIIQNGKVRPQPLIDLTGRVSRGGGEQGLLSVAFHPNFENNRKLYVNFTDLNGDTNVVEYKVFSKNRNRVDRSTRRKLLEVDQPFRNHNGGLLVFGPGGKLFIGMGDGGSGGDPFGNGQSLNTLLGKILRIDVDVPGKRYGIPRSNPFARRRDAKGEIWAYGIRNPWRFSFDRKTGRLFAGDVGQNALEEVDIIVRGGNYGWDTKEASACFTPSTGCSSEGLIDPIAEYGRSEGRSITGGHVYRGKNIPSLIGKYVFGDFVSGIIWTLTQNSDGSWTREQLVDTSFLISSFGEDTSGELYVVDYSGTIYKFVPSSS